MGKSGDQLVMEGLFMGKRFVNSKGGPSSWERYRCEWKAGLRAEERIGYDFDRVISEGLRRDRPIRSEM
jgi:hypothetical protein